MHNQTINPPTISVIIPVYNAALYVKKAVLSALIQPQVGEVILIEDGSSDHSLLICKDIVAENEEVVLLQHPDHKNHGAGASRNLGMQLAHFDYIAFLDADDFYLDNRFEKTLQVFDNQDVDAVYAPLEYYFQSAAARQLHIEIDKDEAFKNFVQRDENLSIFEDYFLRKSGWISLDGLVIRKNILTTIGDFEEHLRQGQDTDFILRLLLHAKVVSSTDQTSKTAIRIHAGRRVYNVKNAFYHRFFFFKTWLKRAEKAHWNVKVNRHIFRSYLTFYPNMHDEENKYKRVLKKISIAIGYLVQHPQLLLRLLK